MSSQLTVRENQAEQIERVLIGGDLGRLNAEERVSYYKMLCESVGLNPLTKPFDYITLNGKLTLYAKKDATDQLRAINQISVTIAAREVTEDCYVVTARATTPAGRTDESIGAVNIANLKGEARANAMMKGETKAKRRVTLSICGLGLLDELEVETIPSAKPPVSVTTEEIPLGAPASVGSTVNKGPVDAPENGGGKHEPQVAPAAQPEIFIEKVKAQITNPEYPAECVGNDGGMKINFRNAWMKACPANLTEEHKERERKAWLLRNGFGWKGVGTSSMIPKAVFEDSKKLAVKFAKTLTVNTAGVAVSDDDIPF